MAFWTKLDKMIMPLFQTYALFLVVAAQFATSKAGMTALADKCFKFVEIDYGSNRSRIEVVDGFATNLTLSLNPSGATTADCFPSVSFRVKLVYEGRPRSELDNDPDFNRLILLTPNASLRRIEVKGVFVGHSKILFMVSNTNSSKIDDWSTVKELKIATFRRRKPGDEIFAAVIFAIIIFGNAGIGFSINWKDVLEVLRRPIGPAIGLCCQYIVMPLASFATVKVVSLDSSIALGIFITGCSPGGGVSNYHTYFLRGDLPLSVTMTVVSTVAALALMPLWIYTLGRLVTNDEITVAYQGIGATLASTAIPLGIGIFVRWWRPQLAEKIFRFVVRPLLVVIFIAVIIAGFITNLHAAKLLFLDPMLFVAAALMPYIGFALGFVIGYLSRQGFSKSITIAVETGIQSIGVAMATVMISLPEPDSDIAILAPIATSILTPIPLWIAEISLGIYLCVKKRRCFIFDACRKGSEKAKSMNNEEEETGAVVVPLVSSSRDAENCCNQNQ